MARHRIVLPDPNWLREAVTTDDRTGSAGRSVLVIGGAGFVGSHLVDALVADGWLVTVLDNLSSGRLRNLDHASQNRRFRFVQGSALDELVVDELAHASDYLVDLVWSQPRDVEEQPLRASTVSLRASEIVIEAADRYRRRLVVGLPSATYGRLSGPATETLDRTFPSVGPRGKGGVVAAAVEHLALVYHAERGLPVTVVPVFGTAGPREDPAYGRLIPTVVRKLLNATPGAPISVEAESHALISVCHVNDVVAGLVRVLTSEATIGEVVNLGSPHVSVAEDVVRKILTLTHSTAPIEYERRTTPMGEAVTVDDYSACSYAKADRLIGWKPVSALETILMDVIQEARKELGLGVRTSVSS